MDQEKDSLGYLIRKVQEGQETVFDLLNDEDGDKKIVVTHQRLSPQLPEVIPEPPIARAHARCHRFHDVDTFAAYVKRESETQGTTPLILADVDSRTIKAVLDDQPADMHDGVYDREIVDLAAVEHPLFTPWAALLDRPAPVLEFALFCMRNRRAIVDPDGRELAMVFSQVKMSKAIQMYSGVGKRSLNGVIVDIEIAGEKKGVPVELPETIAIEVPLFVGTSPQRIEIDLLVTNQGEHVVVFSTAADVEAQRIAAFEEMVAKIREATGQLVGLGTIAQRAWRTLDYQR